MGHNQTTEKQRGAAFRDRLTGQPRTSTPSQTCNPLEPAICDILHRQIIDLAITVPCKLLANLITQISGDQRFEILYSTREEEGLGIAAGAYLAGRQSILLIQNSGLGNMVNAYRSLNQFYGIPLCLFVSHRGGKREKVPAQVPMGQITEELLGVLDIQCLALHRPSDLGILKEGLTHYTTGRNSVAFLVQDTFWGDQHS